MTDLIEELVVNQMYIRIGMGYLCEALPMFIRKK